MDTPNFPTVGICYAYNSYSKTYPMPLPKGKLNCDIQMHLKPFRYGKWMQYWPEISWWNFDRSVIIFYHLLKKHYVTIVFDLRLIFAKIFAELNINIFGSMINRNIKWILSIKHFERKWAKSTSIKLHVLW